MARHKCHQNVRVLKETQRHGKYECEVCGDVWEEELGPRIGSVGNKLI